MCAWVKMTGDGLPLSELPDGFARHHGDGERDVDAARRTLHRDGQPRISRLMDRIRHACGFPAKQEYVAFGEDEAGVGRRGFGRQQHQPARTSLAPFLEGMPVDMPGQPFRGSPCRLA